MRIVLLAKTLPSILHHYLLRHISLLWWWMLPTVSFPSWCILSWLGDILWDPVKELKYGDEPTFRHFPMPSLISFLNVKCPVVPGLYWTGHLSFPKRHFFFSVRDCFVGLSCHHSVPLISYFFQSFWYLLSERWILCRSKLKICCKNQGIWHNSWYFACLSLTVVGVWIDSSLKVCRAREFREICSAVTGWVQTEVKMVPNLPASCVWRKILHRFKTS